MDTFETSDSGPESADGVQRLLIGGVWRAAEGDRTTVALSPVTERPLAPVAAASVADATAAVEAAEDAFGAWSATAPAERRTVLLRAAGLLEERAEGIAAVMTGETGAVRAWAEFNVRLSAGTLREAAAQAYGLVGEVLPSDVPGLLATGVRRPVGVVVGIVPWNAPLILGVRAVAWALAYGNTVVLKASEQSPRTHGAVAAVLKDAGVPDGAVNLVTNAPGDAPEIVEELVVHPAVRAINFTGSTRVGRIIAQKAAPHFKRTLLELGGKAPLVVLDDADLDAAAAAASFGAFMHQGQICMSTERIVVDAAVHDPFVERLAARAKALVTGDPREPGTQLGPMIDRRALGHLRALLDDAVTRGARCAAGGGHDGLLHEATVVTGVTPAMRLYHEESFGPAVSVVRAADTEDAVRIANDTPYGLASAVFGRDTDRAAAVADRLRTGIAHINGATVHDEPIMPFGGLGDSGWGRFGARAALAEFTDLRWITVSRQPREYPI
ncbi:aldehyde dehydrogenase family protein [Streptomyces sp. NPDC004610]|uniref:aldehyde dehydrogenase family protein n=1 Tax=unclassified Streptomyces TaxID=2593676 RepID=UPI0033B38ABA